MSLSASSSNSLANNTAGPLHYRTYSVLFISGDIVCLIVQAIGGGSAASATTPENAESGAQIMVIGVFLQMVVMVSPGRTPFGTAFKQHLS